MKSDLKGSATNLPESLGNLVLPGMLQFQQLRVEQGSCCPSPGVWAAVSTFLIPAYLQNESRMAKLVQLLQISPSTPGLKEEN